MPGLPTLDQNTLNQLGYAGILGIFLSLFLLEKIVTGSSLTRAEAREAKALALVEKLSDDVSALTDQMKAGDASHDKQIEALTTELREERLARLGRPRG